MLGFFTGTVMQRWWAVYNAIPGTAKIITLATLHLKKDKADVLNIVKLVMIEKLKSLICFLFFFFFIILDEPVVKNFDALHLTRMVAWNEEYMPILEKKIP